MEDLVTVRKSDKWFLSSIVGQRKTCFFSENSRSSSNRGRVCLFFFCVSQASGGNARRVGYYTREEKGGKKLLQQTYSYLKRTSGPACLILKKDWKKKENFSCFSNTISNPPGAVVAFKFSAPFTLTIKLNYQLKQNTNINKHNQQTQYQTLLEPLLRLNSLLHLR